MVSKACELCRHEVELGVIEKHYIIPEEVRRQAGIQEGGIVRLCPNCSQELNSWNLTKVSDSTYDTTTKRFRDRSSREIVKEYEVAYKLFAEYKERLRSSSNTCDNQKRLDNET